jgi:hypothetical protein
MSKVAPGVCTPEHIISTGIEESRRAGSMETSLRGVPQDIIEMLDWFGVG